MSSRGFTLVELIISISIFVVMTVLLVVKYGNFNQSVLLTNLAYDVALVMRTAQTYGVSVTSTSGQGAESQSFQSPYGVSFSTTLLAADADQKVVGNTRAILFADSYPLGSPDGIYTHNSGSTDLDVVENTYNVTRGAVISNLCIGDEHSDCAPVTNLNVTFKRPDPKAIICGAASCIDSPAQYAEVTIKGTDGSTRTLAVSRNGQISILQ